MSFKVPYDSSPPSTPDKAKGQSFWSNVSTTPAGPPPSSANSFTPQGHPPSTVFGTSQIDSHSKMDFGTSTNSLFTKSGGFKKGDSIFGSSFGSDFAYQQPQRTQAPSSRPFAAAAPAAQTRFGGATTNGSAFSRSVNFGESQISEYNEEYDEEEEEMEHEEEPMEEEIEEDDAEGHFDMSSQNPHNRLSFLDSTFGNPLPRQATQSAQRKPIYSNPTDAKRPKLHEHWNPQSSLHKTKLSPKKASAMPSILHNFAARSHLSAVDEPADMIINTEDVLGRLYDELRDAEHRHVELDALLSYVANKLAATWDTCADRSGISRPYGVGSSIGPGEQSPNLVKASFLASLLLQIHHPSRASAPIATASNPAARGVPNSMVKAMQRASVATPLPQILLDWLNGNHASQTNDLQALRYVEPNPTASSNFWDIINAAVLRGQFAEAAEILRSSDFNYARSALEDGLPQPGYRGAQLQNIQRCVNKALQILDTCPGFRDDDWDITGSDWTLYRKRVLATVNDLEEFAEGEERDQADVPVQENRFQAVNFGLSNFGQNQVSFTQSARMAESRVPWTIYQSLRSLYRIILGDTATIKAISQDWVEATIGLTAWWDGEDYDGMPGLDFRASTSSNDFQRSRGSKNQLRAVDRNMRDAYLRRLDLAFSNVTNEPSDNAGFRVNTMNSLEVGLASVFEGNVQGVLELLQSWSLCVTTAVTEVASFGGWFDSGVSKMPGLSENDLMVLSYGQGDMSSAHRLDRDEILQSYAFGLNERGSVENESGVREGWEMALEVLARLHDSVSMKKAVAEVVDKLPLDDVSQLDKLVVLCTDLGLEDQGRKVSERFGDLTASNSENFGLALVCYARAQNRRKVKSVVDLLISYSLVQSRAYPATSDLDPELRSMLKDPKTCLSSIASVDEEAARILQFYLSGYATLRRFYEIRDEAMELQESQRPRFKPLARRRAAAKALVAVISSAADNIYGGLYDPHRDSAVQVDGLLALLGEALVFVNHSTPIFSVSQQFTILSAIEDLETVTPRVYSQCEECFRSTLLEQQSAGRGASDGFAPPSPRALLKKSVSSLSASTFSIIGNDMLESVRTRSGSGSGPASVGSSGVLVPRPGDKEAGRARGWDWRVGLPETIKGADVLRMLRLGLAQGLSFGALGSV
ncbi:hypothetical protein N7462_000191 [Penicillium macrosclerotiorum]|uniref:uncharacterized protein n=1 Tax=Penicillium macrosclerotiorum TaxID=303699 RepID=UPI00254710CB|nr:uncharacterized protein N7462_000191 [Penicillium macrosclerotiorum]KAJ5698186.1 hypothetical protein N7462_000191 [Penicillium macrosclerotiorum]